MSEIYFSCDVESDGPLPGPNSMLSFGAAAFKAPSEKPISTFETNLIELPGATPDPDTLAWWSKPEQQAAYQACRKNPHEPEEAMKFFVDWVDAVCKAENAKPVFVAYPAGYDFMFLYWYMIRFAGRSPFSFSALDVKSFAMSVLGQSYRDCTKKNWPGRWFDPSLPHTHVALDDAVGQGVSFLRMLADSKLLARPK